MVPEQVNADDHNAVLENEWIYLDWTSLAIIDGFSMVRQRINRLQRLTNSMAYRMISGVVCCGLFWFLAGSVLRSYNDVSRSINIIAHKDAMLRGILRNEQHKKFFQDTTLFTWINEHYVHDEYGPLIEFITKEFSFLEIRHDEVNLLKQRLSYLNMLITTFPFVLCLSWWTNTLTIAVAFVGQFTPEESTDPSLPYTALLSGFLGMSLLIIMHFLTLFLASLELLRRRVIQ